MHCDVILRVKRRTIEMRCHRSLGFGSDVSDVLVGACLQILGGLSYIEDITFLALQKVYDEVRLACYVASSCVFPGS